MFHVVGVPAASGETIEVPRSLYRYGGVSRVPKDRDQPQLGRVGEPERLALGFDEHVAMTKLSRDQLMRTPNSHRQS